VLLRLPPLARRQAKQQKTLTQISLNS
jgi:hypothetical protein